MDRKEHWNELVEQTHVRETVGAAKASCRRRPCRFRASPLLVTSWLIRWLSSCRQISAPELAQPIFPCCLSAFARYSTDAAAWLCAIRSTGIRINTYRTSAGNVSVVIRFSFPGT